MTKDKHSIPLRKTPGGEQIDTRPLFIEEWLDSLPYVDFDKTSQLLLEATSSTNQQEVKPATRMELVKLYNRPYQYYLDSQIKTGAQHTLESIDIMQKQVQVLKMVAVNLAIASKKAVEETLGRKSLWGQSRPPLTEMLMSLTYLSHAMIFSFLQYASTPKNVWRELNFIFDFAASLQQENSQLKITGNDAQGNTTTIANAYKKIVLASLADPNHLPFGAIWEIYEQLDSWAMQAKIIEFDTAIENEGNFIINLDSDFRPITLAKFDRKKITDKHRIINTAALDNIIRSTLDSLKQGQGLDSSVKFSPFYAKPILEHLSKAWGLPPKRSFPRKPLDGILKLGCGLNSSYFFINNEKEFNLNKFKTHNEPGDMEFFDDENDATPSVNYKIDDWNLVDEGEGGFAIIKNEKPNYTLRVGDLVCIGETYGETGKPEVWTLGTIRWLMINQNKVFKAGVQILTRYARPGAIRAKVGSEIDGEFRRAFIICDPKESGEVTVITSKGLFIDDRELEIHFDDEKFQVNAESLLESSLNYEHFSVVRR